MLSGRTALIIASVGAAIIVIYMFYLLIRLNCRLDAKIKGATCNMDKTDQENDSPPNPKCFEEGKNEKPKEEKCPCKNDDKLASPCTPGVFSDFAGVLVKRLMTSAKKVTEDKGLDKKYYNNLLREIYARFYKLNSTIVNERELEQSKLFLDEIKKEIEQYQARLRSDSPFKFTRPSQSGGSKEVVMSNKDEDLSKIINENEHAIYEIYPSLAF